jgi:flagellar motor switch protein FliG
MALAAPARQEPLTGAQKAAVLCMSLGTETAARVMQLLGAEQVEAVSKEIASMPQAKTERVETVLLEYRDLARAVESIAQGGLSLAQEILEASFGAPKAKTIVERIKEQMTDTGLKRLKKAAPEVLLSVLRGEHPQTVALILAHLDVRQSAAVIEVMDADLAGEVLYRVARMEKVSPEMLALIESGLAGKADLSLSQEMTLSGGPQAVAKVLTLASTSVEKVLLECIQQRNGELAEQITNLMFAFEDLKTLDKRGMQRLLRDIESKELALAMKVASDELKQHILSNMSERASAALQEEIEYLGPVRARDVEGAHQRIISVVRSLEEAGEIQLSKGGDDDLIV